MKALQLCQYSDEQVFHWNSIHSYTSSNPEAQKPTHRTSLTFTNQLETEQLLQIIRSLESQDRIPLSALSELQLDWTQQIGIYLDKTEFSLTSYFKTNTINFSSNDVFMPSKLFEAYIGDYWSSARHYVIDLEHQSNLIQRITDYIDHHYKEDISRTKLAEMVFLSPDHLARVFKRDTGETLVKYITDKRMAAAKRCYRKAIPLFTKLPSRWAMTTTPTLQRLLNRRSASPRRLPQAMPRSLLNKKKTFEKDFFSKVLFSFLSDFFFNGTSNFLHHIGRLEIA